MRRLPDSEKNISLSHATLLTDDLIDAFMPYLERYITKLDHDIATKIRFLDKEIDIARENNDEEELSSLLNEGVFDVLNDIAPEGTYFGAHPGDGSDFGFWESEKDEDDDEKYGDDFVVHDKEDALVYLNAKLTHEQWKCLAVILGIEYTPLQGQRREILEKIQYIP